MRITKLRVTNYRGIQTLDCDVPPAGLMVTGGNGRGKTSALKAIRAALAAQDVGPDAVRIGADKAEIIVDLDAISVRRVITPKTSTVTVTSPDGFKASKPATLLTDLLGTSPLDPLDLLLAKPKERRARILEALPVRVTQEQAKAWLGGLECIIDESKHGLEVVEALREDAYRQRTSANRDVVETERLVEEKASELAKFSAAEPCSLTVEEAREVAFAAENELNRIAAHNEEAKRPAVALESARREIQDCECNARDLLESVEFIDGSIDAKESETSCLQDEVQDLTEQLRLKRTALQEAVADLNATKARASKARSDAEHEAKRAQSLKDAIAKLTVERVPEETVAAARDAATNAARALRNAEAWRNAIEAKAKLERSQAMLDRARDRAARLNAVVSTLTHDAPKQLLAASSGIAGLGLAGDDVTLDGKCLDALCGAEQLKFCVDVAKRLNAKSKILVVDGLERLDADQRDVFIGEATSDGWQLIASCVDRGDVHFVAFSSDSDPGDNEEATQ